MGEILMCRTTDSHATLWFRPLRGFFRKLVGLLGTTRDCAPVALCGCSSVHTFGMAYAIDVALVARNGKVVASRRDVPPNRVVRGPGARYALERPASKDSWPSVGSWVGLALTHNTDGKDRGDKHARE